MVVARILYIIIKNDVIIVMAKDLSQEQKKQDVGLVMEKDLLFLKLVLK
jgi:hypothetical protein